MAPDFTLPDENGKMLQPRNHREALAAIDAAAKAA
jgi:hypothetical protein